MTKKERMLNAIRHKNTDIVPYNIELIAEQQEKVCAYLGIKKEQYFDRVGNHAEKASYNIGGGYIKPGFFKDEYSVVWNRSGLDKDIGIVEEILIKDYDLSSIEFPEPDESKIEKATLQLLNNGRDSFKFGKIGLAYYERAWSLRGMQNLLMDFILEPEFVEELFNKILEYNLQVIDVALRHDIDGFYFGDDYGQQTGMIMSPDTWRKFIKPGLAKMFQKVKSAGKVVALHSCGNIIEIFGDLIEMGLDVYQTFQPELYNLKKVKEEYGNDLTFWGGISTQKMLPFLNPEELKRQVKEIMGIMSVNGGYIAAPTHKVPGDVPVENIAALIDMLKHQELKV